MKKTTAARATLVARAGTAHITHHERQIKNGTIKTADLSSGTNECSRAAPDPRALAGRKGLRDPRAR